MSKYDYRRRGAKGGGAKWLWIVGGLIALVVAAVAVAVTSQDDAAERRDYERVVLLERTHEVVKARADLFARAGSARERDEAYKELLDVETEHQRICARYPKWNRPILRHRP